MGNRIFSAGNTHNLHDAVATSWQQESKMYPQVNYKEEKRFVSSVQPDTAASTGGGEQYQMVRVTRSGRPSSGVLQLEPRKVTGAC